MPACISGKHFTGSGHKPVIIKTNLKMDHMVGFLTFLSSSSPGAAFLIVRAYIFLFHLPGWVWISSAIANFIRSQSQKTWNSRNIDRSEVKKLDILSVSVYFDEVLDLV